MPKHLLLSVLYLSFICSFGQSYNYYYGNIHAHSGYSDGNKDSSTSMMSRPYQDFLYAKQSKHIDFYGISEHNHKQAGMRSPGDWHQGLLDADLVNQDGQFVAMYGMEFGVISNGGHVIVYGSDSLFGWDSLDYDIYVGEYDYTSLWKKINSKPGVFATLAHPQIPDYDSIYFKPYSKSADSAIVGSAIRSGPAFSTDTMYSDPGSSSYMSRYKDALRLGYHVGASLDHDTHYSVFGRQGAGRTVVLANSLTRDSIMDAYRKMRFYSSDDWNVKVDFKVSGHVMGSICSEAYQPVISVNVNDPDTEAVSYIRLYGGTPGSGAAPTLIASSTNSSSLLFTAPLLNDSTHYYYLDIMQADTDRVWTSPVWFKRNDSLAVGIPQINTVNFEFYPNPTSGEFNITMDETQGHLFSYEVTNELGELIKKGTTTVNSSRLDMSQYAKGVYYVRVLSSPGVLTKKLIIK